MLIDWKLLGHMLIFPTDQRRFSDDECDYCALRGPTLMAAIKKRKGKSAAPKDKGVLTTRLVVDTREEILTYYINYIEVICAEHNFSLYSLQVPGKFSAEELAVAQETGVLNLEPAFQMILPPTIVRGLIKALESQLELYEKQFGEIPQREDLGTKK